MWRIANSIGTLTALRVGAAIKFKYAAAVRNKLHYGGGHTVSAAVRAFLMCPAVIDAASLVYVEMSSRSYRKFAAEGLLPDMVIDIGGNRLLFL